MALENNPKISVVMSVYKEPLEWLHQSIDSILNQTISDFEFIIICDNPGYKEGIELLEAYKMKDKRIVLVFNEQNIGLTKSLNKGLAIAKGEYIARMDADDLSHSDRFDSQIQFMKSHPEIDICHTNFNCINQDGHVFRRNVVTKKRISQDLLFWHNIVGHSTVMLKRELLKYREPLYNENYISSQDYELWTFLSLSGCKIGFIDKCLIDYRVSSFQISSRRCKEQHNNTFLNRRNYIIGYLTKIGFLSNDEKEDAKSLMNTIDLGYNDSEPSCQTNLNRILYVLYYTLACSNPVYVFKFFCDRRIYKIPMEFRDIIRILLAPFIGQKYNAMKL